MSRHLGRLASRARTVPLNEGDSRSAPERRPDIRPERRTCPARWALWRGVLLALLLLAGAAQAQPIAPLAADTTAARFGTSVSGALRLTEDGIGAGAEARTRLTDDLSFVFETSLGAARDAREQQFFVGLFGDTVTPLKRSYAVLLPLHVGLERRLFRASIEDNVRPFAALTAGPTFAVQWPYFDDRNGDGIRDAGEDRFGPFEGLSDATVRLGAGGTLAVGVAFGGGAGRAVQSLRFGLAAHVFPSRVDLLEPRPDVTSPSRRTFLTPTVSFNVGRLAR